MNHVERRYMVNNKHLELVHKLCKTKKMCTYSSCKNSAKDSWGEGVLIALTAIGWARTRATPGGSPLLPPGALGCPTAETDLTADG